MATLPAACSYKPLHCGVMVSQYVATQDISMINVAVELQQKLACLLYPCYSHLDTGRHVLQKKITNTCKYVISPPSIKPVQYQYKYITMN